MFAAMTTAEADAKPGEGTPVLTMTIPLPDLARTIRARLAYHGRTAAWLALQLDISATSVSHRMSGRIAWTAAELERAADVLGIALGDLAPALADGSPLAPARS